MADRGDRVSILKKVYVYLMPSIRLELNNSRKITEIRCRHFLQLPSFFLLLFNYKPACGATQPPNFQPDLQLKS